jgi:FSR family fosmidomycin resistance protein-like MFS transporter
VLGLPVSQDFAKLGEGEDSQRTGAKLMAVHSGALGVVRVPRRAGLTDVQRIAIMTAAHFVNDSYAQYLAILLPLLAAILGFSLGLAAVIVTAYTITSSIIQPYLGHIADRHATRLISVVGMIAVAVGASMLGVAPTFTVLLLFAVLSGVGTAAYHPQAAAIVVALSGERRATTMSTYLVGGSLGLALGPIAVARVAHWNLHATPLLMLPGIVMAIIVYFTVPRDWAPKGGAGARTASLWHVLWRYRRVLGILLGVVILRSWTQQGLLTFLPFLYHDQGFAPGHAAAVLAAFGITGSAGGLLGGYLADRFSQRPIVVWSLLLAGPLLVALPRLGGAAVFADAALSGILLLASWNVLTVMGQQILKNNVGMASGLMLGLSIGLGGLAVIPMGILADRVGTLPILTALGLFAPAAGALALILPNAAPPASEIAN